MIRFFLTLLSFLILPFTLNSQPIEFRISSQEVGINEPLVIEAISRSGHVPKPIRKRFELGKVVAVYTGIQTETQIINFKTSSSTILKFIILHPQPGVYKIPAIQVEENGQVYQIPDQNFTVIKKQTQPAPNLMNRFFSDSEADENGQSDLTSSYVRFHTSKSQVYIGEPIIGYFVFYNKNIRKPFFERNPNESISFPFFTSILLSGVKINYPDQVEMNFNGAVDRYFANPYNREIFALTPIKLGIFKIGKTKFDYTNSQRIHFYTHTIDSTPKEIEVLALPNGAPKSFTGEIGVYEMQIQLPKEPIIKGNPWKFQVKIQGIGLCNQFKDPILGRIPKTFPGKLESLSVSRNQKFTEIRDQEYGFQCTAIFEYSLFLNSKSSSIPFEVSYFNTKKGTYEVLKSEVPALNVIKNQSNDTSTSDPEIIDYADRENTKGISTLGIALLIGSALALGYFFYRKYKINTSVHQKDYLLRIQNIAGQKTGLILEKSLLGHGLSKEEAKFWVELRKKYVGEKFTNIFPILETREKEILSKYIEGDKK